MGLTWGYFRLAKLWPGNCSPVLHDGSSPMKILVADCDGSHARELSAQLRAQDDTFSVTLTGPGENLLDAVGRVCPDVVIVDMARPDRDGLDSVRALNARQMVPVL